jgi:hypothetical protein
MTLKTQSSAVSKNEFMAKYWKEQAEYEALQLNAHHETIEAFKNLAARKGLALADSNFSYAQKIGVVATAPGLVEWLIGPLKRERDELLSFRMLTKSGHDHLHGGYFAREQFTLMAHPHFRRMLHGANHFAPRFIELFWAFEKCGVSKFIALDEDRVMLNTGGGYVMELDTWFGAPFKEDISKVQDGTVKLAPPQNLDGQEISWFFADAHCLDIKWATKDGIKTFQAQEIKSEAICLSLHGETFFPVRYLHAEFDTRSGFFRHFDGAMQYFTEAEYRARRDSDFNYNAKNDHKIKARSKKLFKLNGDIKTEEWSNLCSHFFTGNPLMFEYFNGTYPSHIIETLARIEAAKQHND